MSGFQQDFALPDARIDREIISILMGNNKLGGEGDVGRFVVLVFMSLRYNSALLHANLEIFNHSSHC